MRMAAVILTRQRERRANDPGTQEGNSSESVRTSAASNSCSAARYGFAHYHFLLVPDRVWWRDRRTVARSPYVQKLGRQTTSAHRLGGNVLRRRRGALQTAGGRNDGTGRARTRGALARTAVAGAMQLRPLVRDRLTREVIDGR